jgi:predicted transcriptional regulator
MTDLFEWGNAFRRTDPVTSSAAAQSMHAIAQAHHAAILGVLRAAGRPMAAEQISDRCDLDYVAINRRLTELERAGLIYKTTERHRNRSGRAAFRYALKVEVSKPCA